MTIKDLKEVLNKYNEDSILKITAILINEKGEESVYVSDSNFEFTHHTYSDDEEEIFEISMDVYTGY